MAARKRKKKASSISVVKPKGHLAVSGQGTGVSMTKENLEFLEDQLLGEVLSTVGCAMRFHEIDPSDPESIPEEWRELSDRELKSRIRVVEAANLTSAEAPIGLKMSFQLMESIMKNRSKRSEEKNVLNVGKVELPSPVVNYDEIDIDSDE